MKAYFQQLYRRPSLWLALAGAVLYCSWPLAYILNPVLERYALASQLEAPHQPFNWVFIGMDVLTGVVLVAAGALQLRRQHHHPVAYWIAWGYVVFGATAALAAIVPLDCDPEVGTCGPLLRDPFVLVHGAASIISVLALLASLVLLAWLAYRSGVSPRGRQVILVTLVLWLLFGIGSLVELALHITGNLMQDYFITLCSLSVVVVIGAVEYLHIVDYHEPDA